MKSRIIDIIEERILDLSCKMEMILQKDGHPEFYDIYHHSYTELKKMLNRIKDLKEGEPEHV